eukprot:5668919-Prymnesium_polylepis.1
MSARSNASVSDGNPAPAATAIARSGLPWPTPHAIAYRRPSACVTNSEPPSTSHSWPCRKGRRKRVCAPVVGLGGSVSLRVRVLANYLSACVCAPATSIGRPALDTPDIAARSTIARGRPASR